MKYDLDKIGTFILILFYLKFFYIIPIPGGFGAQSNQILPMVLINCFMICTLQRLIKWNLSDKFASCILLFHLYLIIEIFYTLISYKEEPIINSIKEFTTYTNLFCYFIFIRYARKNLKKFINVMIKICITIGILFIIQGFLYNFAGIKFLFIQNFSYDKILIDLRNGKIRLFAGGLITFTGMLSIGLLFQKNISRKEKKLYIFHIIVTLIYELFISQLRSAVMGFFTIIALSLFFISGKSKKQKYIIGCCTIIILIILIPSIISYFSKVYLSISDKSDYSMYHRVFSFGYYLSSILKRPIFGIGLLNDEPVIKKYYYIVHGPGYFAYCYSDVGLIGTYAKLGIGGLIFYLSSLFVCCKNYIEAKRIGKVDSVNFVACLIILFSCINLSLLDAERIMIFPLIVAISNVTHNKLCEE